MMQEQSIGTIFVTGGTGFVGSAVCRAALRYGFSVVALSRRGAAPGTMRRVDDRLRYCAADISDTTAWSKQLEGCIALVHCIGILFQDPRRGLTHSRVTVASARIAAHTARAAGVPIFGLVSARPSPPPLALYSRAKHLAEQEVVAIYPDALIFRAGILTGASKPCLSPLSWVLPPTMAQNVDQFADELIAALVKQQSTESW